MSKITLGIDIAKKKFDVAILFENDKVKRSNLKINKVVLSSYSLG